jgi:hypothetical protein
MDDKNQCHFGLVIKISIVCVEYGHVQNFKLSVLGHVAFISIGHFGIGGETRRLCLQNNPSSLL